MRRPNDIGGSAAGPVDPGPHDPEPWQCRLSALVAVLGPRARNVFRIDEFRRTREDLEPDFYKSLSYFELWSQGLSELLIEKGVLSRDEIDDRMRRIAEQRKSGEA
jgi:nitrile hydratase